MAFEADKVVVELLAKVDQFDQPVKQSATQFNRSMDQITTSAAKAEQAVTRSSAGRASALQRESAQISQFTRTLSADMVGVGDLMLSDRSPFVAPVKAAPAVSTAVKGMGVAVGALGGIMSTVAGVGVALLIAALVEFIAKSRSANSELDDMVAKLKEQHDRAKLSAEAQRLYDQTVEGSIDSMAKLTAEIAKQNLTLEDNIALQKTAIATALANVSSNIGAVSAQLATAVARLRDAQQKLDLAESGRLGGENPAATLLAAQGQFNTARQQVADLTGQLIGLNAAADNGARALDRVDFPLLERNAKNAANPIAAINQKYDEMADKAKKAGTYTEALADSIEKQRQAAIKLAQVKPPDPIAQFKGAVIGAEGTGPNRLGSSAAGYGQFMPSTFLSYFDRLFPDKAQLTDAAKLSFRDVRNVAEAVIDKATDDYVALLKKLGADVTAANLYTVHLLGNRDATKFLNASASTPTSSILSGAVLAGNPFLRGTVGQARGAIAGRIGDSSSAVSSAAVAIAKTLDDIQAKMSQRLADQMDKEQEVTVAKEGQAELSREILANHTTLQDVIDSGILPSLKDWEREYDQIKASQEEINRFGEELVDDILNPDNWRSWGSIGKTILRDLEGEFIRLAALNPLKNLLFGQNNPTLGGVLSGLFGGGGGFSSGQAAFANDFATLGFASGGRPPLGRPSVVGENGPELWWPDSAGTIIPNGARAAVSGGGGGPAQVFVGIEASEYFDGRVLRTTGPVMAQVGASAANGGATIARRNLGRESQHRLE